MWRGVRVHGCWQAVTGERFAGMAGEVQLFLSASRVWLVLLNDRERGLVTPESVTRLVRAVVTGV